MVYDQYEFKCKVIADFYKDDKNLLFNLVGIAGAPIKENGEKEIACAYDTGDCPYMKKIIEYRKIGEQK